MLVPLSLGWYRSAILFLRLASRRQSLESTEICPSHCQGPSLLYFSRSQKSLSLGRISFDSAVTSSRQYSRCLQFRHSLPNSSPSPASGASSLLAFIGLCVVFRLSFLNDGNHVLLCVCGPQTTYKPQDDILSRAAARVVRAPRSKTEVTL